MILAAACSRKSCRKRVIKQAKKLRKTIWRQRERLRNRQLSRSYTVTHLPKNIDERSNEEFKRMLRMDRENFHKLFKLLEPYLFNTNIRMAILSSGSYISKQAKVMCCLRFLAGASYLYLLAIFGVSKSSLYSTDHRKGMIWPVIDAINACVSLQIGLDYKNKGKMDEVASGFSAWNNGAMHGCVSAIDGWVCPIQKPSPEDAPDGNVKNFMNRSGCWALVVLAGCDHKCRFNMFSAMNSGATNDALAWSWCPMKEILESEDWPEDYYVIGDEAFVNTNRFLVPYAGTGLAKKQDSFNYCLSKMRQCIERAFGLMVQRWGILWRSLRVEFSAMPKLLMAIARLHNFCINAGDEIPSKRYNKDCIDEDMYRVTMNREVDENADPRRALGYSRRQDLTEDVYNRGIIRPPSSLYSRAKES